MKVYGLHFAVLTLLSTGLGACSGITSMSGTSSSSGGSANQSGDTTRLSDGSVSVKILKKDNNSDAVSGSKELLGQKISKENKFKGVQGFLVKDSERLRATINECLDANLLVVQAGMNQGADAVRATGRKAILPQTIQVGGADIVERFADDLYNPLKTGRAETAAGTLSLEYLGALATVADVVAWNCDFANPAARCNCGTEEGAKKILQRCIPSYPDSQIAEVAKGFAASCSVADVAKKREALAAFLSSSTFAEAR
jgi:hypothetical protein